MGRNGWLIVGLLISFVFEFHYVETASFTTPTSDGQTFTVSESAAVNHEVTNLVVVRTGTNPTATITWSLTGTDCNKFRVDPDSNPLNAKLLVNGALDYETKNSYTCSVNAAEAGVTSVARSVVLSIENVYDVAPSFGSASYTCSFPESDPAGTVCTQNTTPNETETGDRFTCTLEGTGSTYFNIDSGTCKISLRYKLDRETVSGNPFTGLTIKATDLGNNVGTASLTVSITDVNDNAPSCTISSLSVQMAENVASGHVVSSFGCTDADTGVNADLNCSTSTANYAAAWSGSTCILSTSTTGSAFDYDTLSSNIQNPIVNVVDKGSTVLTTSYTFTVTITPVDDNDIVWGTWTPAMPADTSTNITTVAEDAPIGQGVFTAVATDADKGETVAYSISITGCPSNYFTISSSTGVVSVGATLDREPYSACIVAVTATAGSKSKSHSVSVGISPVNEFAPFFNPVSGAFTISVAEGTSANTDVLTMPVTDVDEPTTEIVCSITSGDTAVWQLKSGATNIVQTKVNLVVDAPTSLATSYTLGILCKDNGGTSPYKSATATVGITVTTTSNDFDPTISVAPTTVNIDEDTTTVDLATLTVADKDGGTPGTFACSITSPVGGPFALTGCTTVKRTGVFDYETTKSYDVVVRVTDNGTPNKLASATLTVNINNVDDNDPSCPSSPYSFTKLEDVSSGTSVGTVTCQDADLQNFTYSIVTTGMPFAIDATSGEITTSGALNYDDKATTPYYQFNVRAVDKGSRGLSTTAQVTVHVTNVNQHDPTFVTKTETIPEDTAAGTVITTFTATDDDGGNDGTLVYALSSVDNGGTGKFSVEASTGKVTLLSALDYDASTFTTKKYELTITATDRGSAPKSGTGTLTVSVTDINDSTPVFASTTYSGTVAENSGSGTGVSGGPVVATDADSGAFGTVRYSITAGNTGSYFTVGATSGAVTVASTGLNHESTSSYTLTITATDNAGAAGGLTAQCTYLITVTDVNEFTPTFDPSSTSVSKPENTALGALIFQQQATDQDTSETLTYSIDPANPTFTIESTNGKIHLARAFDFETTTSYSLTIKAVDSVATVKTGELALTVSVTDVNEFTPVCTANPVVGSINESLTGAVSTISCTDGDSTKTFVYTVASVNGAAGAGKFMFSSNSLRLDTAIDYETDTAERDNTVVVTVSDSGPGTANTATVTVTVSILPVNEATPSITSTATATVQEGSAVDTLVKALTATDSDSGSNHGTITWTIVSGNTHNYFKIVASQLLVAVPPDREVQSSATLTIQATDGGGLNTQQNLVVTITDANDNAPVFNPTTKVVNVLETAATGSIVDDFDVAGRLTDADADANAVITLSILSGADSKFSINGKRLEVAAALSAATKNYYSMVLQATDGGTPALTSDMNFVVNVLEVNSAAPTFSSSGSTVTVSESTALGQTIYDVNATDTDGGLSGTIKYNLTAGDTYGNFDVDLNTGKVIIKSVVDYERPLKVFHLVILATDSGIPIKSSSMTLTVSVTDQNDNQPVFTSPTTKSINENVASGGTVITATVSDADSGVNADVTFSIASATHIFAINPTSGVVTLTASPDRETQETYVLTLKAVDKGTPALTGYQTLTITILDENDNTPIFAGAPFTYSIAEDAIVGTLLTTVSASDNDKPGTAAATITYSLEPADGTTNTSFFSIDSNGRITTAMLLDRETTDTYQLHVLAKDGGAPVLTGTLAINITVTDVNDNTPVITGSPYSASVSESAIKGTLVQQITATDSDAGVNAILTYTVVSGNTGTAFATTTDGKVVVNNGLDRETTANYVLLVQVNDNGSPKLSATATVSVAVTDINDNAPIFPSNYTRYVVEGSPVGTNVGAVIAATDADVGANGAISYIIVNESPATGFFSISGTQIQVASASLDRETVAQYELTVEARDNGSPALTGTCTVTVIVTDINDNIPVFGANYTVGLSVAENSPVGTVITTITASDSDKVNTVNSYITFAIDTARAQGSKADVIFLLNSTSGVLSLKSSPDYEVDTSIGFYVNATDNGTNTLSSTTYVYVTITDVNDNAPVFSHSFYEGEMAYNDVWDTIIIQVSATDQDSGNNGVVNYKFVGNAVYLLMGSSTGRITRNTAQTGKAGDKYIHFVQALDGGSPTQSNQVTTRVDVYDPENVVIQITVSLTLTVFLSRASTMATNLKNTLTFKYPNAVVKFWRAEESTVEATTRRRLLANGVNAYFYVVQDDSTSNANSVGNPKSFVLGSELMTLWTVDENGNPSPVLRGSTFTETPIVSLARYPQTVTTLWYTTTWGIAVLTTAGVLFLIAVAVITFLCVRMCKRKRLSKIRRRRIISVMERPLPISTVEEKTLYPPPKYGIRDHPPPYEFNAPPSSNQVYRDPKVWGGKNNNEQNRAETPPEPPSSRNRLIVTGKGDNDNNRSVTPVDIVI